MEEEVFKRYIVDFDKLLEYGFSFDNSFFKICIPFLQNQFIANIQVDKNGIVTGKVIDSDFNEEYTNFRIESVVGEFVGKVKSEYLKILNDIREHCFIKQHFIFEQSNSIASQIYFKYNIEPEFLWEKFSGYGVFRELRKNKWFAIIMNIDKSKIIEGESGEVEVLNLKLDDKASVYLQNKGVYKAFHLNKNNWVSIILDGTIKDDAIMQMVEISYAKASGNGVWLVPANPRFYDVIGAFNFSDIILWKQSSKVLQGDTVYLYVTDPYSAIMFKCKAIKTNIPYYYKSANVKMKYAMKLKLEKQYNRVEFPFEKLKKKYGIKAIRGPRSIPKELIRDLEK